MAKLGDYTPQIIDKAIDFIASSQAFREYLAHQHKKDRVPDDIPTDKVENVPGTAGILSPATGLRVFMKKRQSKPMINLASLFRNAFFRLIRIIQSGKHHRSTNSLQRALFFTLALINHFKRTDKLPSGPSPSSNGSTAYFTA
jgi:hypothetical protein